MRVDTFRPLRVTTHAASMEDDGYPYSRLPGGGTPEREGDSEVINAKKEL